MKNLLQIMDQREKDFKLPEKQISKRAKKIMIESTVIIIAFICMFIGGSVTIIVTLLGDFK